MVELTCKLVNIADKKTCIRLAKEEWDAFDIICNQENIKRSHLINLINTNKNTQMGLTYAVRLFSIVYFHHLLIKKSSLEYSSTKAKQSSPIFKAINGIL